MLCSAGWLGSTLGPNWREIWADISGLLIGREPLVFGLSHFWRENSNALNARSYIYPYYKGSYKEGREYCTIPIKLYLLYELLYYTIHTYYTVVIRTYALYYSTTERYVYTVL